MDYDGNDFQSQNFQLSGEDNNRFSSGLRSFSLPKFELDEQFQVHLRFDSLVEPESLLGIQDQEESSWIEDFSSGHTALEFTPGVAESCSISGRKNVWSEATSSESVEILLRSVGEDDVNDKRTTIFDLDSHNGSSVNNHMDSSCAQDVSLESKELKAVDADSALPPDKCEEDLGRINKDVTSDLPDVQDVSKSFNDEELGGGIFEELDEGCKGVKANTCGPPEQCGLKEITALPTVESFVTEEKSLNNSSNEMTLNDNHSDYEFVERNASNDHVTSITLVAKESKDSSMEQIDPSTSSVNITINDSERLSAQNIAENVTEKYNEDVLHAMSQNMVTDDGQKMETQSVTKGSEYENEPPEGSRIEQSLDVPESLSSLETKAESSSLLGKGHNEHIASERSDGLLEDVTQQIEILSKGDGMTGLTPASAHETHALVMGGEINPDVSIKICSSDNTKQSTSMKVDSFEQVKEGPYDATLEQKVSLEEHDVHVENVLEKNAEVIEDSEGGKPWKPVIVIEKNEDSESYPPESNKNVENSGSFMELHVSKNTDYGAQGTEEKEDDNLGIHLPELTFRGPESVGIQKKAEDEKHENSTRIVGDALIAPTEVVQEFSNLPSSCAEDCVDGQISELQDAKSSEKCNAILELEGGNSDAHITRLPEKECAMTSASSDILNSHMKEKPQDASAQNQNSHTVDINVERQPAVETTQAVTGDVANCEENSLQSVSLSRTSEPHSLEDDDDDPSSFKSSCSSPTVIACTQPSCGELEKLELKLTDQALPVLGDLTQSSSAGKNSEENMSVTTDPKDPKESDVSEERSFTFEVVPVANISERASVHGWKPFPIVQSYESPEAEDKCSTVPDLKQANFKVLNETPNSGNKSTHRDKSKSVTSSSTERSKRKSVKETPTVKEVAEKNGTSGTSPPINRTSTTSRDMQLEEKYQCSYSEGGGVKLSCTPSVQTSSLPDLNTGAALFHQPFTDLQQVQLRAQIFVYGSLIQGIPPDEACMISAFGNADGGRNAWDGVWRITLEKFHSQKSPTANLETPLHSHSGLRVHESDSRSSSLQNKVHTSPISRINNKGASTVISNLMSLPSPLWNVSSHDISQSNMSRGLNLDPNQILSPLHGHQSSHGKQYIGSSNPWISQASPLPWVATSHSSTLDTLTHFSASPIAETVQLTPIRDTSVLHSSNLQFLTPSSFPTAGVPLTVSATTVHVEPVNKTSSRAEKHSTGIHKTRKRRKSTVSETPAQVLPGSQPRMEPDSVTALSKNPPTYVGSLSAISSSLSPTHFQIIGTQGKEQNVIFSEEVYSKIEQAKLQSEDAAAFAAAAIRHMESIWSQLSAQKHSGLGSEIETTLASAAVAAAAASSVAKAAAAAAKVASDAAMQAKMMADEALPNRMGIPTQGSQAVPIDRVSNFSRVTHASHFKDKDKTISSSSVISAAKEAARKRVEAASAASKRAENLDAIVKAAELAAVAVCQAGAVIAMGDPLPFTLSDLIDAGPEGYWKAQHTPAERAAIADTQRERQMALDPADGHNEPLQGLNTVSLSKKHRQHAIEEGDKDKASRNELRQSIKNQIGVQGLASCDVLAPDHDKNHTLANIKEKGIHEGSLVEVLLNEDSPRRVWYSAKVLSVKDGKAYVCANDFNSSGGSDKLKEWISLEGEVNKPPRIRIAHPTTAISYEGTRKRRRAALCNYGWVVGDRVDAWTHDSWCEGVVTEKSKDDETKFTVRFSAGGDTSIIKAWHLRPSLVWKDGQWVEWSRPRENLHEGDTPQEKRQKLGRLETENDQEVQNKDDDKQSADLQIEYSKKTEESRPLLLTENNKIFSVGKNVREDNNLGTLRIKRTGQKEGSRVVFGVPKPGKKRKFMEVSKHYVTGKINNVSEGNDAIKHAKYLPPQAPSGWKNPSKVELRGRKVVEPKPKLTRLVKPEGPQTRSATEREGSFLSTVSASNGSTAKTSASHKEKSENIMMEAVSFTSNLGAEERTVSESSMRSVPGIPTSKMKTNTAIESDVGRKGKVAFALEKTKNEEKHSILADHPGKTISDAMELRRSSRRIQPTSRLLEGLQSSMIIAKIPSVSQEKGSRASHRNAPSSKGNIHG